MCFTDKKAVQIKHPKSLREKSCQDPWQLRGLLMLDTSHVICVLMWLIKRWLASSDDKVPGGYINPLSDFLAVYVLIDWNRELLQDITRIITACFQLKRVMLCRKYESYPRE